MRALASLALLLAACGPLVEEERVSALLITLDTTNPEALSCYGATATVTANLDRLAAEGIVFENARTVAPLTLPAHASMLTGLVPLRHSVRRNGDKEPFFVVHGAGGNVIFLSTLGRAMPDDRPVYGFQAKGVNKGEQMDPSVEAMAASGTELRADRGLGAA